VLSKILVTDNDLDTMEQVRHILEAEGYEVLTSVTGQAGIALAQLHHPHLILLDIDLPDIDGYEVCRALRATPSTAKLPILIYSARAELEDKVAGFRAGATDYLVKPVAAAELIARVQAAIRSGEQPHAHAVALWGSKGGVGVTAMATNLAMALQSKTGQRVTLMDASVLGGTLEVMLNLAPQHTIADLLPRLDDLDAELLTSVLARHSSGVRVLLSMPWSKNGQQVQPTQLEHILAWLREASDYIVIDTAPSLDQSTMAVLQLSDQTVVVLTPEMTSLRNTRLFLRMAEAWEQTPKLVLALNRYPVKGGITARDIEAALEKKIDVQIPNDEALVTYSINRGIPLVTSHQRSPVGRGIDRLAEAVIARAEQKWRLAARSTVPTPSS